MESVDAEKYFLREGVNQERLFTRCLPEDRAKDNPVSILVNAAPHAAKVTNDHGSLPLHLAVLGGKGFRDGLRSLISVFPVALSIADGEHQLFPFALAAVHNANTLDVVYELLLANPSVLIQTGPVN